MRRRKKYQIRKAKVVKVLNSIFGNPEYERLVIKAIRDAAVFGASVVDLEGLHDKN